jgi:hypothetical protein
VPVAKSSDAVVPPNGRSMCVWASIAAGQDVLAGGVDRAIGLAQRRALRRIGERDDALALDPHVGGEGVRGGDDGAVRDERAGHGLLLNQGAVGVGATIAEELPGAADLLDQIEVELGHHQLVLILGAAGDDLAARVHEVRVP